MSNQTQIQDQTQLPDLIHPQLGDHQAAHPGDQQEVIPADRALLDLVLELEDRDLLDPDHQQEDPEQEQTELRQLQEHRKIQVQLNQEVDLQEVYQILYLIQRITLVEVRGVLLKVEEAKQEQDH
jgi:hypothetical protein